MKLSPSLVLICFALMAPKLWALDAKTFSSDDKLPKAMDLYAYSSAKKLGKLSSLKWYQNTGKYQNCVELAEANRKNKELGVWLAYTHASCLYSLQARGSNWKASRFLQSFKKLEDNKSLLLASPFNGHRDKLLNLFLKMAKLGQEKARTDFEKFINRNSDLVDYMDNNQRADYYQILGEFAWLRQKNELAKSNLIRSYRFKEDRRVLKRLKAIDGEKPLKINKYGKEFNESEEENKVWRKFTTAKDKGQTYNVAQHGVAFLSQFPGSKRVETVRDQINSFYKRLLYRRGDKYVAIKRDFEKQLTKAPPLHVLFWATEAYERGYQDSAFRLADKAADLWEGTPYAADALILAARSAYFQNQRRQARKLFSRLIEKYSGHSASFEAHYLLGLLYYREEEYKKVILLYDDFLQSAGSDKYELQVRYWLWRSLKKVGSSRSSEIAESIFKIFPLTYYGLVVRMEEKGGLQNILGPEPGAVKSSLWWTQNSQRRWERIKRLIELGWLDEAETEIDFLPDPQTPEGFLVRAKLWRAAMRENRAIQDFAAAVDLDLKFLTPLYLSESFPQNFKSEVEKAEKEFNVSRNLIWAIMRQESAFRPRAISPSNAYGLMQLLSPTAKETAKWLRVKNFRVLNDIFNPAINVRFGTHFISRMLRKYKGVVPLSVASYNVGPGNLDRWLNYRSDLNDWQKIGESPDDDIWMDELPWAETSFYVKAVMRNYLLYKLIHEKYDKLASPAWKEALIN